MEIETLQAKLPHTKNYRSSDCKLLAFDLPSLITTMKQSVSWANGELNAMILLKSPGKQIILAAMHEGTEIESYQANDSITFQIIEGNLKFHVWKDTITLHEGQLITLDEKIKYSLSSMVETVFMLTITDKISNTSHN